MFELILIYLLIGIIITIYRTSCVPREVLNKTPQLAIIFVQIFSVLAWPIELLIFVKGLKNGR